MMKIPQHTNYQQTYLQLFVYSLRQLQHKWMRESSTPQIILNGKYEATITDFMVLINTVRFKLPS